MMETEAVLQQEQSSYGNWIVSSKDKDFSGVLIETGL
jgi:hypothetical protein